MKQKKFKAVGVAIPWEMYRLVMALDPDLNFSEIVRTALKEKYIDSFAGPGPITLTSKSVADIEMFVDSFGG